MYRRFVGIFVSILIVVGFWTGSLQVSLGSGFSVSVAAQSQWSVGQIQPVDGELWISPYGTENKLRRLMQGTEDILYIQTYDFTHKGFRSLMKSLGLGGTDVRIMQENKKYRQYADTYQQVVNFFSGVDGVQVKSDEHLGLNFLHTKLALTDRHYSIQTANLTQSAFKNREYFLVGNDPAIWENLYDMFVKDWHGEEILPDDIHPNLLICPINCREVLESLIASATESIWIQTQYIVDNRILHLLKQQAGLDLQMIVADLDSNRDMLYYFGPKMARSLSKPYVHAKTMLIDNKYLYIGSINFSDNSMDNNRELGIIVTNPEAIDVFRKQFVQDWGNGVGRWR